MWRSIMKESEKGLVPSSFKESQVVRSSDESKLKEEYQGLKQKLARKSRIVFVFDATGSRSPFWEIAIRIQEQMLQEVMKYGEIEVKIVAYRDRYSDPNGYLIHSKWSSKVEYLVNYMRKVTCHGGGGNDGESIDAALDYVLQENKNNQVNAVILVGDEPIVSMDRGRGYELADEHGRLKIPIFAFLEGNLEQAEIDFRELAKRSKGIFDQFSNTSPQDIADRLKVAAIYTAGGEKALEKFLSENKQLSPGATNLARRLLPEGEKK